MEVTKFWRSTRFWALVLTAIVYAANTAGWMPAELANALYVVLVGNISIRSLDRFSEEIGKKK